MFFKFLFVVYFFILVVIAPAYAVVKSETQTVCPRGEHWVRAHAQSAYVRDGKPVSGSFHKAGCSKNPPSYAIWHDRLKSGFPPNWQYKSEKSKPWTEGEKERVFDALSELPPELLSQTVTGIYRMKVYLDHPPNPAATFENQIALYDMAFKRSDNLARILGHEFAHFFFRQMSDEMRYQYAKSAEWGAELWGGLKDREFIPRQTGFVEEDGKDNPEEDFSNNVEYFMFNPQALREKTPKVYEWISKKYGDKFKLRKVR